MTLREAGLRFKICLYVRQCNDRLDIDIYGKIQTVPMSGMNMLLKENRKMEKLDAVILTI